MTKVQMRDVIAASMLVNRFGARDSAAKTLSAAIRCAKRASDIRELRRHAEQLGLSNHPDFIC